MSIDRTLQAYQRFGVSLGLERIKRLLTDLGNPQQRVPAIHVAGTNGKGSVCTYLSSILAAAGYRVGRYTSPHLVDWCERICLNDRPIAPPTLQKTLDRIAAAITPDRPCPTQFEVLTAAAWLYFAEQAVDIAVVEVGLGGRLDATNAIDRPLVSIITSISWDHCERLGNSIAAIAGEKAGILKSGCPAVIGELPPDAQAVVANRLAELKCPAVWVKPAQRVEEEQRVQPTETPTFSSSHPTLPLACYNGLNYPLPLAGEVQFSNSALAIEAVNSLRQQGWAIADAAVQTGMANAKWSGRLQWVTLEGDRALLVDGAHNLASAQALRQYVDTLAPQSMPTAWVVGMLSTKDRKGILQALLRSGDRLYLVPVPGHSSAELTELAQFAEDICPQLKSCQIYGDLSEGLTAAAIDEILTVLCGSLYLVGHFFRQLNDPDG
jgi:dihydrofolate synthase/folylpolyglutamate synthase